MVLRFLKILVRQRVCIDNNDGVAMIECELVIVVRLRMVEMAAERAHFECRCVHGHNDIRLIARCKNFASQFYLEATHATQSALRCAYLSRKIRQGGDFVTKDGTQRREQCSRQLHAIT